MELDRLFGFVFVFYCVTIGIVLVVIPWTSGWDQMLVHVPYAGFQLLKLPVVRGGLSGFGLVHLLWGLHDLHQALLAEAPARGVVPRDLRGVAPRSPRSRAASERPVRAVAGVAALRQDQRDE